MIMHTISQPSILYFGTPVVLVSTVNDDTSFNLAPISSVFWLGWRCVIGISTASKSFENLTRTKQCVLNLPSVNEVQAVNRLALITGKNPVPLKKLERGYRYESNKFEVSGLHAIPAETVSAPRVLECPVHLEAHVVAIHPIAEENTLQRGRIVTLELKIVKVHLEESILMKNNPNRIDPDKWHPLIMSFQEFYGLGKQVNPSALAQIPEHLYQTSDMEFKNK
jgi:flavin reductase (DIM6/NTAB) family NADH-FMN oxidoreductase RutF